MLIRHLVCTYIKPIKYVIADEYIRQGHLSSEADPTRE